MKELARLLKAVADTNRLRILCLLQERQMCVCELSFILGITQPAVSKHLKKLSGAGIVQSKQDHFWTNYYLREDNKTVSAILCCLGKRLKKDTVFKADSRKLKKVNRVRLCCKKQP